MDELINITLEAEVANIEKREASLKTIEGQKRATGMMLDVLRVIEASGYQPKADLAEMAAVWVSAMKDQIAVYRFQGIHEAVMEFIKTDTREYKQFPSVGQIINLCNQLGRNPRAELARRNQEIAEKRMSEEYKAEISALPKEYRDRCVEKYSHLWKGEQSGR